MDLNKWNESTAKAPLRVAEMDRLITESAEAWAEYDEAKAVSTDLFKKAEAIDAKILLALKEAGKSKYFVDGVGTMSIIEKLSVTVPKNIDAKKDFFSFLKKKGETLLYSMLTVNSQTLNAWYNEEIERASQSGKAEGFLIPGIDQPTLRESLRLVRDKKGSK